MKILCLSLYNRPAWGQILIILVCSQFPKVSMENANMDPLCEAENVCTGEGDFCIKQDTQRCHKIMFYELFSSWRALPRCSVRYVPYNHTSGTDVSDEQWERMVKEDIFKEDFDHRKSSQIMCPSILEISNQGICESCWAVAATDVMTDRLCIMSKGVKKTRHSVADLLSCCGEECTVQKMDLDNKPYELCQGGGMHAKAWAYWVKNGIVSGHYKTQNKKGCRSYDIEPCVYISKEEWEQKFSGNKKCSVEQMYCPKITNQPSCKRECDEPSDGRSYYEEIMKGKACYKLLRQFDGKENLIKAEIKFNGPVHAFMTVYSSFYTNFSKNMNEESIYSGVPSDPNDEICIGGHSIRIVGWGTKNGSSYWIVANSYGEKWGLNGFFYLDFYYDYNKTTRTHIGGKNEMFAGIPEF